ncbi:efflux RND transporter periplasmic adaptor subunit [Vibrio aestuarianus]|uniref:Efflux RND transporter periplasmic adaptor subunit n=1 Tax=Vibrio aestuarianus TaxID=28171 RepID=A0A9X4IW65_9VIBR|nr:efflux RND transporter periplasmic adaptor subunit [Vibrio aestuarianus]MDE1233984.1 efflux RND transporter periplasmic adaptor subunit [Vibrio aestuarianus]MDE1244876.1 efflux RND transporter periplasmic adaptor subunit [Vibrio aestuarianus]MDE1345854.1 efflux RND transporter periplasmic adaptor subunit [Vibrio aestuarianus]NGZ62138.1 efflux RND transporter periplasmic adaptor subunit [Vibrio aestuarianus subsp. cardii]
MKRFKWTQRFLFIPPVLIGVAILVSAPAMKAEPPKIIDNKGEKVVRVLKVAPRDIHPSAIGYGHTQPARDWEAQAELEGAVVWINDNFHDGNIIKQGNEILRLDPSSYQLSIARLEAELEVAKLTDQTILETLNISEQEYQVQKSEYERTVRLSKSGHISKTDKDKATKDLLNSQQQFQTQKNNLAINKATQKVLLTELALAKRDLEHTIIKAPFDVRVTDKMVGLAEYVNKGEIMLKADGIDAVEINAQFPLGKMRPLRRSEVLSKANSNDYTGLEAIVELNVGEHLISWDANVSRSGGHIDAQTQSQSIVVQIDNPLKQASPGQRPPLIRDTFVKVTLKAPVMSKQTLLPLTAIHNDKVYLVQDGKLKIQPVKVDFVQGQIAVIKSGIQQDDIVVLSKLSPAVEGMLLKPQPDKNINQWLDKETGFKLDKPKSEVKL